MTPARPRGSRCATSPSTDASPTPARTRASPSYRLAYGDADFFLRDELRPVRLQLELLKPEFLLQEKGIGSTVLVFGSSRIPDRDVATARLAEAEAAAAAAPEDAGLARAARIAARILDKCRYYDEARKLGRIVAEPSQAAGMPHCVVATGGGPGIMEAANRGASDAGAETIGFNIVPPYEQTPNRYITPDLCFQFHYFAIRKLHFLMRARALVVLPGGFGTMDELFEALTLIQTEKIKPMPVILFGEAYWKRIINFDAMVEEGVVAPKDLELFQFVEKAEDAWRIVCAFYPAGTEGEP
jgi:uncharacterized protein (TIGR00730 family)